MGNVDQRLACLDEAPANAEIRIDTAKMTPEQAADLIIDGLLGD